MRLQTLIGSLVLTTIITVVPCFSVSAVEPTQDDTITTAEVDYIRLVTEPDDVAEDVYYVMNGNKNSGPHSFTWVEGGIAGTALQLDGNTQHVRLATDRVKELTSFTFSAWFNWAGNKGEKEQRLLSIYKNENHTLIVSPHNADPSTQLDGIQLTLEDPQIEPVSLYHPVTDNVTSALPINEWHHLAITLSDTEVALYIDGALYASQTLENFSVATMDLYRLVIGSEFDSDANFNGLVDNALLYNAVLDTDQIKLLAENRDPLAGGTPTSKKETLATKPYVDDVTPENNDSVRILGLSPIVFAILGGCLGLVIILFLVLTLYRKNNKKWQKEEDHP